MMNNRKTISYFSANFVIIKSNKINHEKQLLKIFNLILVFDLFYLKFKKDLSIGSPFDIFLFAFFPINLSKYLGSKP